MKRVGRFGMGLVEVLVAGAILAVVMLGVSQFVTLSFRAQKGAAQSTDFNELSIAIRLALSTPGGCACNLAPGAAPGPYRFPAASAATARIDLDAIQMFSSGCVAGPVVAQRTAAAPPASLWVRELRLRDFFRVDDAHYFAQLEMIANKSTDAAGAQGLRQLFPVTLTTSASGGMVTLQGCHVPETGGTLASDLAVLAPPGPGVTEITRTVSTDRSATLHLTGHASANYNPPAGNTARSNMLVALSVNGVLCGASRDLADSYQNIRFHGSAYCIQPLGAGTHTLRVSVSSSPGSPTPDWDPAGFWTPMRLSLGYSLTAGN